MNKPKPRTPLEWNIQEWAALASIASVGLLIYVNFFRKVPPGAPRALEP